MMFTSPDTLIPDPYNPLDWNRYLYARANPIRYSDPSGHLSEDEIMNYFGVTKWEQVLAVFEKGGALEGKWGWLATLRQAEIGSKIEFLQGFKDWFWDGKANATVLLSGKLTKQNGQLYLSTPNGLMSLIDAGKISCDRFGVYSPNGPYIGHYRPEQKYSDLRTKEWSRLDKVDLAVDGFGIVGDIAFLFPPIGTGVWILSEVPELLTSGKSYDQLDIGDPSGVITDLAVNLAQLSRLVPEVGAFGNLVGIATNVFEISP